MARIPSCCVFGIGQRLQLRLDLYPGNLHMPWCGPRKDFKKKRRSMIYYFSLQTGRVHRLAGDRWTPLSSWSLLPSGRPGCFHIVVPPARGPEGTLSGLWKPKVKPSTRSCLLHSFIKAGYRCSPDLRELKTDPPPEGRNYKEFKAM